MGPFIDPRNLFRTPGFAQDDLYDDQIDLPPAPADFSPSPPPTSRDFDMPPPPQQQQRQRIELPAPPLPPKPGLMRKIIGTAASMYVPQIGREILAPGYGRKMQEYRNDVDQIKLRSELDHRQAQTEAQMASAEANNARKQAELSRSGSYGPPTVKTRPNEEVWGLDGKLVARGTALPEKPAPKGLVVSAERGRALGLHVPEGAVSVEVPVQGAAAALNTVYSGVDKSYLTLKKSIQDAHPEWDQPQVDAEASRLHQEKLAADKSRVESQATRNLRAPAARTATTSAAESRRTIDEMAKAQIAEAGDIDKAIANMNAWEQRDETAEKVLLHLKSLKGGGMVRPLKAPAKGLRGAMGAAPSANKAPAHPGKVKLKAPTGDVMEVDAKDAEHYIKQGATRI